MGLLSANLLTALQKSEAKAVRLLELGLPSGTVGYSDVPALGGRVFQDRVLGWGPLERGVNVRLASLDPFETEVTLADTDHALSQVITGSSGTAVRNAVATIKLACEGVASADWFTLFSGRVEAYQQAGPMSWTLKLRPQDLPLNRESCPKAQLSRSEWPNCPAEVVGVRAPLIYGKHDSVSGTNSGAVPLILVDTLVFRYLLCAGRAKAVSRVYVDGTPVSGWTTEYLTRNGRLYTVVTFTATQGDLEVTADVEGLDATGDGSGALIEEPAALLKHLLVNFIYGDWQSGSWLSDSTAPIDTTAFSAASTFFSNRGYKAAKRIDQVRKGVDLVNEFLASLEAKGNWTWGGKIALRVESPALSSVYVTGPLLVAKDLSGWNLDYPTGTLIDRVDAEWLYQGGEYLEALQVRDLASVDEAPDAVTLPWSAAAVV